MMATSSIMLSVFYLLIYSVFSNTQTLDPPSDWQDRIAKAQMLYTATEPTDSDIMATVGNGYLATVIGSNTIYLSGVFNGRNTEGPSHRAVISATNSFSITGAQTIGSALDLELATYYRRLQFQGSVLEQRWYAHRVRRSIMVYELYVDNSQNNQDVTIPYTWKTVNTPDFIITHLPNGTNYYHYFAKIATTEEPDSLEVTISVVSSTAPTSYVVPARQKQTFYVVSSIRTNLDSSDPINTALADFTDANNVKEKLHDEHVAAWSSIWDSRIEMAGDLRLAQVLNSSQYYILSSVRDDWPHSLSPGGLASNGYNGHVFWDTETWMYPGILLCHPSIAKGGILQYRFDRLDGAAKKAQSYKQNYKGYMFPWESAFTGQEVTPSWADTGELEQHISGDIAFAIKQYWDLTNDNDFLSEAFPVVYGIAEFWESRVYHNTSTDQYEINGVIPPDEYAVNINNSVFTNVVAAFSLDFATYCGKLLNKNVPSTWSDIAKKMKIPEDLTQNIHLEYDGYNGKLIKQADVILLGYPLMYPMTQERRRNDLVYYQERTDAHGPAMTYAMENVAFLELGDLAEAAKVWPNSWANAKDPFMVWTETPTGGAVNFITGAGGFLQAVLFGYGGIRLTDNEMKFDPQLPPSVSNVIFRSVFYRGNQIRVEFNSNTCTVTKMNQDGTSLMLRKADGSETKLELQKPLTFTRANFLIHP